MLDCATTARLSIPSQPPPLHPSITQNLAHHAPRAFTPTSLQRPFLAYQHPDAPEAPKHRAMLPKAPQARRPSKSAEHQTLKKHLSTNPPTNRADAPTILIPPKHFQTQPNSTSNILGVHSRTFGINQKTFETFSRTRSTTTKHHQARRPYTHSPALRPPTLPTEASHARAPRRYPYWRLRATLFRLTAKRIEII